MNVYLFEDALINLEQVQSINTIETGRGNTTIWFHFKSGGKSVGTMVSNNKVSTILQECYKLMKGED